MKRIPLGKTGKYTLVDDTDFDWLNQFTWFLTAGRANRNVWPIDNDEPTSMSRLIMGCKRGDGILVDHKDGNRLNNQRYNLRRATVAQNCQNSKKRSKKSVYKGVRAKKKRWEARITCNGKAIRIGTYPTEIEAAYAYDKAALEYHGEFARLNFPIVPQVRRRLSSAH